MCSNNNDFVCYCHFTTQISFIFYDKLWNYRFNPLFKNSPLPRWILLLSKVKFDAWYHLIDWAYKTNRVGKYMYLLRGQSRQFIIVYIATGHQQSIMTSVWLLFYLLSKSVCPESLASRFKWIGERTYSKLTAGLLERKKNHNEGFYRWICNMNTNIVPSTQRSLPLLVNWL